MANASMFLLYLKALIWSVFVSYTQSTVMAISLCLRDGEVKDGFPEFKDTHLGDGLKCIIKELPRSEDRECLAKALDLVKDSKPSLIYQNMVMEVGHYVVAKDDLDGIAPNTPGVVYCLQDSKISVLFRNADKTLTAKVVHPFQIMPVYTLTIPDSAS